MSKIKVKIIDTSNDDNYGSGLYTTAGDDDRIEVISAVKSDKIRVFFRTDVAEKYRNTTFDLGSGVSDAMLESSDVLDGKEIDLDTLKSVSLKTQLEKFLQEKSDSDDSSINSPQKAKIIELQNLIGMTSPTGNWNGDKTDDALRTFIVDNTFDIYDKNNNVISPEIISTNWKDNASKIDSLDVNTSAAVNNRDGSKTYEEHKQVIGPFGAGLNGLIDFIRVIKAISIASPAKQAEKDLRATEDEKEKQDQAIPTSQVIDISNGYTSDRNSASVGQVSGKRLPVQSYVQFRNKDGKVTRLPSKEVSSLLTKVQRILSGNDRITLETPSSAFVVPITVNGKQYNTLISRIEFALIGEYKYYTYDSFNQFLKEGTFDFDKTTDAMFKNLHENEYKTIDRLTQADALGVSQSELQSAVEAAFIGPMRDGFHPYMTGNSVISALERMQSAS